MADAANGDARHYNRHRIDGQHPNRLTSIMQKPTRKVMQPTGNMNGGATGILIALVLVLALAGGGGFWAYTTYLKKKPLQTNLSSCKVKAELVQFTNDYVSRALYHNLITIDGIVVMMDEELKRLKRIGSKFPNQSGFITNQTDQLVTARDRLSRKMKTVTAALEKIYVIWLVDRSRGISQINSQKGTLTRQLADAIRDEAVLIGRIRSNPQAAS